MASSEPNPHQVPPPVALHRLMTGHWIAQAIFVAAQLGVADSLRDGPQHTDALARSIGTHPGALYRLLRALASVGVFTEVEPQCFALTPIGTYLQTEIAGSLRALARTGNVLDWEAWGQLLHSVKTGAPAFRHVHGMDPFTYFQHHPEVGQIFDEAMTGFVTENGMAVVTAYDFTPFTTIVDVGGGHGALMVAILRSSPATRGVLLELPSVLDGARATLAAAGLSSRCEYVAGDFFAAVPTGGDAYLLASIIHDWDAVHSVTILQNCRRAMAHDAKLLLVEMVVPPGDAPSFGKWLDLEMLVCFGGRERTEVEYQTLLETAGFRLTRLVPTHTPASIIEAMPVM
jgi:hypothetical protein